jgi:hypothetical protein
MKKLNAQNNERPQPRNTAGNRLLHCVLMMLLCISGAPVKAEGNSQSQSGTTHAVSSHAADERADPPGTVKNGTMKLRVVRNAEVNRVRMKGIPDLDSVEGNVHVVNVYEGQYPGGGSPHNYYYNPKNGWVDVFVSKKREPVVLLLGSYEYVDWRFRVEPGTKISAVIIMTYHPCTVKGLPVSTPIFMSCYEAPKKLQPNMVVLPYESDSEFTEDTVRAKTTAFVKRNLHRGIASYQYEYKLGSARI